MNNDQNFSQSLKNIDQIYNQTIKKLTDLHNKKIKLIERYLKVGDNVKLEKIRQNLKNNF